MVSRKYLGFFTVLSYLLFSYENQKQIEKYVFGHEALIFYKKFKSNNYFYHK